jgi:hypothetical protein
MNLKIGDKLYCKKQRYSKYSKYVLYKWEECTIIDINNDKENLTISSREGECSFHTGEYDIDYYNFTDYFYTLQDYRRIKLDKLNNFSKK